MAAIPEGGLLRSLQGYVSAAVGCSPDRITAVSRFQDGNRHAVYRSLISVPRAPPKTWSYGPPTVAARPIALKLSERRGCSRKRVALLHDCFMTSAAQGTLAHTTIPPVSPAIRKWSCR